MTTEMCSNVLERPQHCCSKCKGLFTFQDERLKHQLTCTANPFKSPCTYFACERKIFLQLFQPEDFQMEGAFHPLNMSKDDSFINPFVKIRMPDAFDPSVFLRSPYLTQNPSPGPSFLLEDNIDTLDTNIESLEANIQTLNNNSDKDQCSSYIENGERIESEDQIQSIINKNIEYLKNDTLPNMPQGSAKSSTFSPGAPRLLSPIDRFFNTETSRSRMQSPFDKHPGFIDDTLLGCGSYAYPSNMAEKHPGFMDDTHLGYHTGSYSYAFNQYIPPDPVDMEPTQPFATCNKDNQFLDIGKKDPFLSQTFGVGQINTKDPFLINAAVKEITPNNAPVTSMKPSGTRSCKNFSTTFSYNQQSQDTNYFSFPSTLDEPTQLDYLDLATLDFLTNPNLINYGSGIFKTYFDKDDDMCSEDNLVYLEQASVQSETVARLEGNLGNRNSYEEPVKFSKDKVKPVRLKKCKSDLGKPSHDEYGRHRMISRDLAGIPSFGFNRENCIRNKTHCKSEKINRKRKMSESNIDGYRGLNTKQKLNRKRLCKSGKIFNVREKLTFLTEEQKDRMKAVIGKDCIFVKKQMDFNKEPVVVVEDIPQSIKQMIDPNGNAGTQQTTETNLPSNCGGCVRQNIETKKLTSVLILKCLDCEFTCSSGHELKEHCRTHKTETELATEAICEQESSHYVYTENENNVPTDSNCDEKALTKLIDELTESAVNDSISELGCNQLGFETSNCDDGTSASTSALTFNRMDSYTTQSHVVDDDTVNGIDSNSYSENNQSHIVPGTCEPLVIQVQSTEDNCSSVDIVYKLPYRNEFRTDQIDNDISHRKDTNIEDHSVMDVQKSLYDSDKTCSDTVTTLPEILNYSFDKDSNNGCSDKVLGTNDSTVDLLPIAEGKNNYKNECEALQSNSDDYTSTCNNSDDIDVRTAGCDGVVQMVADNSMNVQSTTIDFSKEKKEAEENNTEIILLESDCDTTETDLHESTSAEPDDKNCVEKEMQTSNEILRVNCNLEAKSSRPFEDRVDNVPILVAETTRTDVYRLQNSFPSIHEIEGPVSGEVSPDMTFNSNIALNGSDNFDHMYFSKSEIKKPSSSPKILSLTVKGIKSISLSPCTDKQCVVVDGSAYDVPGISDGSVEVPNKNLSNANDLMENIKKEVVKKQKRIITIPKELFTNGKFEVIGNTLKTQKNVSLLPGPKQANGNKASPKIVNADRLKTTPDMSSAIYSESEVLTFVNRRPKELTVNGGSEFLTCVNGGSDVLTTVKSGSEVLTSVNSGSEVFTHENSGSEIFTQVNGWSEVLTQVNGGSDILTPENGGSEVLTRVNSRSEVLACVTSQSEVLTCVNGGSEVLTYVNGGLETGHIADEAAEDGQLEDGNEEDLATKLLSCNACGFKTDNKNKYYNHLLKHRGVVYRCMYQGCSFKSIYKRNYDYHVRIKHTEKTIYQCENCSYNTCEKNSLNRHVQHQHLREMRYKCADCDFTALFRIDVVKHVRNTHIQLKVYACNQCEFRTCYPHVLKYHLMAHAGIRPYKCSACEYQVNNPGQVRRHIQTVHPDRHDVKCENLDLSFEIDARQFKCAENVSDKDIKVIELTKEEIEEVRKMQAEEEAKGKVLRPRGRKPAKFLGISRTSDRVERDTDILNGNSHEVNDNDVALLGYSTALDDDAPDVNGNADVNENLQGIA